MAHLITHPGHQREVTALWNATAMNVRKNLGKAPMGAAYSTWLNPPMRLIEREIHNDY